MKAKWACLGLHNRAAADVVVLLGSSVVVSVEGSLAAAEAAPRAHFLETALGLRRKFPVVHSHALYLAAVPGLGNLVEGLPLFLAQGIKLFQEMGASPHLHDYLCSLTP